LQPIRKIRIQLQDSDGDKYNLSLEGSLSREKMLKILTLMDSVDNNTSDIRTKISSYNNNLDKLGDKIWNIIKNEIKSTDFSSSDILKAYNQLYKEATQLSIVSTYLTRFFIKNKLTRRKHGKEWIYTISNEQITQKPSILANSYSSTYKNNVFIPNQDYEKPSTVYDLHQ
jgi:hypothetical protein